MKSVMMKSIPCLILVLFLGHTYAQDPEEWQALEFKTPEDYRNNEAEVLKCADFVLRAPADAGNPVRRSALNVVSRWMSGTPDYTFSIDESIAQLMKKNAAVLSIYMAAMTKFVLENPDQAHDEGAVKLNAFEQMLTYCEDSTNKVEITSDLKKAIKAKDKGQLKKYLRL